MILVFGANSLVGRGVVSELCEAGVPVRVQAAALSAADFPDGFPDGVEAVPTDASTPASLRPVLQDVDAAFLVGPFLSPDTAPAVVKTIGRHTRRIVYLSCYGAERAMAGESCDPVTASHAAAERLIRQSCQGWTFLRPTGGAAENLWWAGQIRNGDVVRAPFGDLARPLIHEQDVAAVAARALVEDGHAGHTHVLTGPRSLTTREQVDAIAEAVGRPLAFEEIPVPAAREAMLAGGHTAEVVDSTLAVVARLVSEPDSPEPVNKTVEDITDAPARTFHEWAVDHVDDFR